MTPEEFVFQHANEFYDPAKAHEYYLRNRELKGRNTNVVKQTPRASRTTQKTVAPSKVTKKVLTAPKIKSAHERQQEIQMKVAALKVRLEHLRGVLQDLVKKAQDRSGIDTTKKTLSTAKSQTQDAKNQTPAQKREAAKQSKDYYEKHKKDLSPTDQQKQLEQQIKDVEDKIRVAMVKLKQAVDRARNQTKRTNPAAIAVKPKKKGNIQNGTRFPRVGN